MEKQKDEFSKADLYRGYPYMTDMPADRVGGRNEENLEAWLKGRSVAPINPIHRRNGEWRLIFHFWNEADADAFATKFCGERLPNGRVKEIEP